MIHRRGVGSCCFECSFDGNAAEFLSALRTSAAHRFFHRHAYRQTHSQNGGASTAYNHNIFCHGPAKPKQGHEPHCHNHRSMKLPATAVKNGMNINSLLERSRAMFASSVPRLSIAGIPGVSVPNHVQASVANWKIVVHLALFLLETKKVPSSFPAREGGSKSTTSQTPGHSSSSEGRGFTMPKA